MYHLKWWCYVVLCHCHTHIKASDICKKFLIINCTSKSSSMNLWIVKYIVVVNWKFLNLLKRIKLLPSSLLSNHLIPRWLTFVYANTDAQQTLVLCAVSIFAPDWNLKLISQTSKTLELVDEEGAVLALISLRIW